jgi:hypothetical protein
MTSVLKGHRSNPGSVWGSSVRAYSSSDSLIMDQSLRSALDRASSSTNRRSTNWRRETHWESTLRSTDLLWTISSSHSGPCQQTTLTAALPSAAVPPPFRTLSCSLSPNYALRKTDLLSLSTLSTKKTRSAHFYYSAQLVKRQELTPGHYGSFRESATLDNRFGAQQRQGAFVEGTFISIGNH